MRRIGALMGLAESDPEGKVRATVFERALQELGRTGGRNVRIDCRWATTDNADRLRSEAAALVAAAPDVILANSTPVLIVLQQATQTVPIVFVQVADPVGSGLVPTLTRPGGNITGFTTFEYAMVGKWLEVLKETAPSISRVLIIQNPANFAWPGWQRVVKAAALSVSVTLTLGEVRDQSEIERTITAHVQEPNGGQMQAKRPSSI